MSDQVTRINLDVAPFDVRLPKHGEPDELVDTAVQPDLALICNPRQARRQGLPWRTGLDRRDPLTAHGRP